MIDRDIIGKGDFLMGGTTIKGYYKHIATEIKGIFPKATNTPNNKPTFSPKCLLGGKQTQGKIV